MLHDLRVGHAKAHFADTLTSRWDTNIRTRHHLLLHDAPPLPPPLSLLPLPLCLLPWRGYTHDNARTRILLHARQRLFTASPFFGNVFPHSFPVTRRPFASRTQRCLLDRSNLLSLPAYVPPFLRDFIIESGQDWLHRLIQPLSTFPCYFSLPRPKRRVLFAFRTGTYPCAVTDGRIDGRPSTTAALLPVLHRFSFLASHVGATC